MVELAFGICSFIILGMAGTVRMQDDAKRHAREQHFKHKKKGGVNI